MIRNTRVEASSVRVVPRNPFVRQFILEHLGDCAAQDADTVCHPSGFMVTTLLTNIAATSLGDAEDMLATKKPKRALLVDQACKPDKLVLAYHALHDMMCNQAYLVVVQRRDKCDVLAVVESDATSFSGLAQTELGMNRLDKLGTFVGTRLYKLLQRMISKVGVVPSLASIQSHIGVCNQTAQVGLLASFMPTHVESLAELDAQEFTCLIWLCVLLKDALACKTFLNKELFFLTDKQNKDNLLKLLSPQLLRYTHQDSLENAQKTLQKVVLSLDAHL
jgi:hypothetical protein